MTYISDEAMATSSDEFPVGMKFTREPIENPLAITCNKGTMYKKTCAMSEKLKQNTANYNRFHNRGRAENNKFTLATLEKLDKMRTE